MIDIFNSLYKTIIFINFPKVFHTILFFDFFIWIFIWFSVFAGVIIK